ncbi:unnamed protein product [Ostreobium quekettii]|uniref:Armadillo-type fold n=1 Tax=Ostreobium quekettii TaxID=121088 RepID=A0A8S1J2A9_9CHLO|nr:unnamed protein product [Ostreobium quekettii]
MPQMRNNIVNGMMRSVVRIDDLNTQAILDGLRNALNLLQDWQNLATSPASPPDPAGFDVHHMEGLALTFLCSVDVPIRVAAVNILKASQKLHQTLRKKAQSGDQGLQLPEDTTYVMDVLEEMGPNIVEHCYWDFGEWSDMWRRWRHVDEGVSLWDAMRAFSTDESDLRWSRCLGEMAIETSCTCEAALDVAYAEGCHKLTKLMSTDSKGTLSLPHDAVDGGRLNLWRNYCAFCCGCPLYKKQISRTEGVLTTAELFRLLVVPLTGAPVAHQQSAILALGHCNAECYDVLFRELRNASSRANLKAKSKSKFEEVRLHMANVLRIVAYSMPPGTLNNNVLRKQFLLFMDSTVHTLVSHPLDGLYDVHQLCYCLCSIAASTALELIGSSGDGLTAEMRKTLFNLCSQWCAPGYPPGRYEEDMKYLKAAVLAKVKDTGSQKEVEDDFALSCSHLEHAARTAMVAMLQGPLFDNDKRLTGTSIGTWIDYLMTSGRPNDVRFGPSKCSIARQALTKLLVSNLFLFDPYVDQCYSANSVVATVYFQVICEVYCSYADVDGKTGVLLSLVLYKANDEEKEVREDALHLLKVIAEREWNGPIGVGWSVGCGGDVMLNNAVVLGSVQDSCQCFQYQLSETLAREHPEVNEELCVELMTRQLSSANQQVLLCLIPWMERLSFSSRWEGEWSERLLKSMYYVTWKHGKQFTYEVEKLWSTVSSNKENIVPILDFLVSFGMKECASQDAETLLQYFSVLKRISLYLARTSPQRTIDHWVSEASQMIQSEDELGQEEEDKDKNMSALKFSTLDQRGGLLELAPQRLDSIVAAPESAHPSSLKFRDSQDIPPFSVQSATSPWSDGSASSFRSATDYPLLPSSSLKRSTSNISAPGSDRRGSEVSAPFLKGFLTQPELALTLLVEVAFEHGEKFNEHLPVLFHIAVICMDSVKPVVRLHCQQLIVNLLNALAKQQLRATKHPEQNAKLAKLAALISSLQSMKGQPLWPHEDVDLRTGGLSSEDAVSEFVNAILSCSNDESTLRTQWIQEASTWAVECRHRHAAWRSHQVLRALQPAPSSELFLNLLQCLKACFSSPTAAAMQSVLELLRTLKAVMSRLPPSKMVLYPQIFWTCVALLPSDYVHIFRASVEVLHYMLQCSSLSNDIILNVLLATAPTSAHNAPILYSDALPAGQVEGAIYSQDYTWSHTLQQWAIGAQLLLLESGNEQSPVLCLQQLLLKGVCMPDIQTSTLVLITLLAKQMAQNPSGLFGPLNMMTKNGEDHEASVEVHVDPFRTAFSSVLGDLHAQLFTSLMGIVPWICVAICNQNREHIAEACEALARACDYNKFDGIGATVMAFIETDAQGLESAVQDFCSSLCEEAPAMFICVMVGQWTSLVQNSDLTYARVGMTLLGGVFASRGRGGLQSNAAAIADLAVNSTLFAALGAHLQGSLNHEAKRVLSSMVSCASGQTAVEDGPQWATALEIGLQLQTSTVFNTEQVVAALSAMLETCPQHLRKNSRRVVMPFVSPSAPMSEPRTSGQVR